ncbi:MAG TPA: hypothetical protein PKN80_08625 [bacterium]|nr:hypothetical protein [bacterium]HNS48570.1 hypothetical protein [bacterium]
MDIKGRMVKVRFKKYFAEQRLWLFLGRVLEISENWIQVEGRGIVHFHAPRRTEIDEEPRVVVIPRDNIAHIRILPDSFTLDKIEILTRGGRFFVKVPDGPDTSIGDEF